MKHVNIPIFIPHAGCPHACVFCDQRKITGVVRCDPPVDEEIAAMTAEIEAVLSSIEPETDAEIAFFGGSFTAIGRERMTALLEAAQPYLKSGRVSSLRCSTRPDSIGEDIPALLRRYGMTTVELGVQSLDDSVLSASRRGHTASEAEEAIRLLKAEGFSVVGQMMLGLPASDREKEIMTAERLCMLGVDGARVYPTGVIAGTALDVMRKKGEYSPLSLEDAVGRAADVLDVFDRHSVPVIRCGLCEAAQLHGEDGIVAGISHPAFGQLASSEVFFRRICTMTEERLRGANVGEIAGENAFLTVFCPPGKTSEIIGQKRCNSINLKKKFKFDRIKVLESVTLSDYNINVFFDK